mmetsp:Transcript_23763/g.49519  ORF Transcript_23763/g.49519 Transcript_23763/m.49519 type:complete len:342 (+) Transcript_23763:64-1089(+)
MLVGEIRSEGTKEYCLSVKKVGDVEGISSTLCYFVKDRGADGEVARLPEGIQRHSKIVVTAANEIYLDRLANLIGSLHFWEPPYLIVVYDIGLSPASKKLVASWHNVVVKKMEVAGNGLPDHFALPPLVAYKSWVIEDAMRNFGVEGGVIMWLDANTEVRRSLGKVEELVRKDGHFFTLAGHDFPTHRNVRVETMKFFNDDESFTTQEVTSAIMGFKVGGEVGIEVLRRMTKCALDLRGCHYPTGSTFRNQKRDQSGLNSILRTLGGLGEKIVVHTDEIYWAYASQDRLKVTDDETDFNDIIFFSRRGEPPMNYVRRILPEPPQVQYVDSAKDVHDQLDEL